MPTPGPEPTSNYARIERFYRERIESGELPIDHKLPTETELAALFSVGRGTVRKAMANLEQQGFIVTLPAKGTFVVRQTASVARPAGELFSFSRSMLEAGRHATTRLIPDRTRRTTVVQATGRVREAYGLPDDAYIVEIWRLRGTCEDGPLALQMVALRDDFCPGLLDAVDLTTSLYRMYGDRYGVRPTSADELLKIGPVAKEDAPLLGLKTGDLVVIRDRISFTSDLPGQPANTAWEVLHSVEGLFSFVYHYSLMADFTAGQRGARAGDRE